MDDKSETTTTENNDHGSWDSESDVSSMQFSQVVRCGYCNMEGHRTGDRPRIWCHFCGETWHISTKCYNDRTLDREMCYYCNEERHLVRQCPTVRCHLCWEQGHLMRDCKVTWLRQQAIPKDRCEA